MMLWPCEDPVPRVEGLAKLVGSRVYIGVRPQDVVVGRWARRGWLSCGA